LEDGTFFVSASGSFGTIRLVFTLSGVLKNGTVTKAEIILTIYENNEDSEGIGWWIESGTLLISEKKSDTEWYLVKVIMPDSDHMIMQIDEYSEDKLYCLTNYNLDDFIDDPYTSPGDYHYESIEFDETTDDITCSIVTESDLITVIDGFSDDNASSMVRE